MNDVDAPQLRPDKWRVVLLGVLLFAPTAVMLARASMYVNVRAMVAAALVTVLVLVLASGFARSWRRTALLLYPVFVVSAAGAAYAAYARMPPGHTLALLIASMSVEELVGFVQLPVGTYLLTAIVAAVITYPVVAFGLPNSPIFGKQSTRWTRALLLAIVPVALYVGTDTDDFLDGVGLNPASGGVAFLGSTLPMAFDEIKGRRIVKIPYRPAPATREEVHVLVIGESARKASWSAYGYARDTTPYLSSLTGNLVLLTQAVADANLTSLSVPILLTGIPPQDFEMDRIHGNLVDLAHEAGYQTTWLANQDINISTATGVHADRLFHPVDLDAEILMGQRTMDEVLIAPYRDALRGGGHPRFIGMHLMGSHWQYFRRYPQEFAVFGSTKDSRSESADDYQVDTYDNSIRYTDSILKQIIEGARELSVPATVTYFPDHGEDLEKLDGEKLGHGATHRTRAFELPAFFWYNDAYARLHPDKVQALHANVASEMRSHDVFYTVADLMGIRWNGFQATRSFASPAFAPDSSAPLLAGGLLIRAHSDPSDGAAIPARPMPGGSQGQQ